MKKHKVKIPKGYEFDKEIDIDSINKNIAKENKVVGIVFKPIKKELPKTWEEILPKILVSYVVSSGGILWKFNNGVEHENMIGFPTEKLARADEALRKLIQLRDYYNENSEKTRRKVVARSYTYDNGGFDLAECTRNGPLWFTNEDSAKAFLVNFSDLLKIATPLL